MFDIGFPELVLILVIALLVFGPGKMAEIGRELGKAVRDFRRATTHPPKEVKEGARAARRARPRPRAYWQSNLHLPKASRRRAAWRMWVLQRKPRTPSNPGICLA